MVDALKIAAKVALIVVITAGIIALFTTPIIPGVNLTEFNQAVATGKAIVAYWVPGYQIWLTVAFALLAFRLALWTAQLGFLAVRWVLKVNE